MKTILAILLFATVAQAEPWTVTAYCPCRQCCGKADGIMANGKRVHVGAAAVNHLPFGTKLYVDDIGTVTVEDRGHKRYFGDWRRRIRRMDIFMPTHAQAVAFGVKVLNVERFAPVMVAGDCSILVW
jgi:3D (Asp-Asp-Asp) domain-containing protein